MSNEIELDWLARTEHHWPKDAVYVSRHENAVEWHYVELAFKGRGHFTQDQWLTRRAELQNKPSWADAPEWAVALAQDPVVDDDVGSWWWHGQTPSPVTTWCNLGIVQFSGSRGEILGDWRDTLERRPADLSEPAVTQRLDEATQNVLAAVPELKSEKYKFKPFTSIEDNQEQEVKQDNGWFERGELPPVGVECEALFPTTRWNKVKFMGIGYHESAIIHWEKGPTEAIPASTKFRPIRTERDLAIEEMMKAINVIDFVGTTHHLISEISSVMYDAGYRKEQK